MHSLSVSSAEPSQHESVRRYFTKLSLRARPDVWAQGWGQLPVEGFFIALRTPQRSINIERKPCSEQVESLASLFDSVRWA